MENFLLNQHVFTLLRRLAFSMRHGWLQDKRKISWQCTGSWSRGIVDRLWEHKSNILLRFKKPAASRETSWKWDKKDFTAGSVFDLKASWSTSMTSRSRGCCWDISFNIATEINAEAFFWIRHSKLDIAMNNENEFGLKPFKQGAGITQSVQRLATSWAAGFLFPTEASDYSLFHSV
jgi:hypothetical protein